MMSSSRTMIIWRGTLMAKYSKWTCWHTCPFKRWKKSMRNLKGYKSSQIFQRFQHQTTNFRRTKGRGKFYRFMSWRSPYRGRGKGKKNPTASRRHVRKAFASEKGLALPCHHSKPQSHIKQVYGEVVDTRLLSGGHRSLYAYNPCSARK